MPRPSARILLLLGLLSALPLTVRALDFRNWREDSEQIAWTSTYQQASNQAFNIYDDILDAGFGDFALFWVGEKQENGGSSYPATALYGCFGDAPAPTQPLLDNRSEDADVMWNTWPVVTTAVTGPAPQPAYTPNVPQGWSPVEEDIDNGSSTPDHFLVDVSFTPTPTALAPAGTTNRDQVLNAYWPETKELGTSQSLATSISAVDAGRFPPYWLRNNGDATQPGLRIKDLAPVQAAIAANEPLVPVVTQPPILARVPCIFSPASGQTGSVTLPCVYLVVGSGEAGSGYARIICVALQQALPPAAPVLGQDFYIPNTNNPNPPVPLHTGVPPVIPSAGTFNQPPLPTMFNPATGGGGMVMWSYTVTALGGINPTPVAGMSFADLGDTTTTRPTLFVTTADGQLIALNAEAADTLGINNAGVPPAGNAIWSFQTTPVTPISTNVQETPGFSYGMAPAVCRVPLTEEFGLNPVNAVNTIADAANNWNVSVWEVFVADTYGNFYAFEAPGQPIKNANGQLTGFNPLLRWEEIPPGNDFRHDLRSTAANPFRERFITPPVCYQGNTPLRTNNGSLVAGSSDIGLDDEILFSSERGRVYCYDAIGKLTVAPGNASDGEPAFRVVNNPSIEPGTSARWTWPDSDTPLDPEGGVNGSSTVEPRVWPRTLPQVNVNDAAPIAYPNPSTTGQDPENSTLLQRNLGLGIAVDNNYFSRSPIAIGLGASTDPDGSDPNLDVGQHHLFVPYMQEQAAASATSVVGANVGIFANYTAFLEYVGSLKPYGFIQVSQPIQQLDPVILPTVTINGNTYKIPEDRLSVGSVKANGVASTLSPTILAPGTPVGPNPNYSTSTLTPQDTIYFIAPNWYDDASKTWVSLPFGSLVTITYQTNTSATNPAPVTVTETLPYPSCYRQVNADPDDLYTAAGNITNPQDAVITRGVASLSENHQRLEQEQATRINTNPVAGTPPTQPAAGQPQYTVFDEGPANILSSLFSPTGSANAGYGISGADWRQGAMMGSGSASALGTLMAPSWYRGRVIALTEQLQINRSLYENLDPRYNPNVNAVTNPNTGFTTYGLPRPNGSDAVNMLNGNPATYYGPPLPAAATNDQWNRYDPAEFYIPPLPGTAGVTNAGDPNYTATDGIFLDDEPAISNVGGSVSLVDGWEYITWRNGYIGAFANSEGGAPGTQYVSPYFPLPGTPNSGNVVYAPMAMHLLKGTTLASGYVDTGLANNNPNTLDPTVIFEYGSTAYVAVDFGPVSSGGNTWLQAPGSVNVYGNPSSNPPTPPPTITNGQPRPIDGQVLNYPVQGQIRSSNGAIQQLPGVNQGVLPSVMPDPQDSNNPHVMAIVPIFLGMPSGTNPLTPGTPLLWEKKATDPNPFNTFTGQLTYDIQVTQQALQWQWPWNANAVPPDPQANHVHYWQSENNSTAATTVNGTAIPANTRFPTTAGTTGGNANWNWSSQWAPLISYNNPIGMYYNPSADPSGGVNSSVYGGYNGTTAIDGFGMITSFVTRNDPGRKNGDMYTQPSVDGSRSGSGTPVIPYVGVAVSSGGVGASAASSFQTLYASDGSSTATSATGLPEAGVLHIYDRSMLAAVNPALVQAGSRSLQLRVQAPKLTKLGIGAGIGSTDKQLQLDNLANPTINTVAPLGSFQQNALYLDDGPDGMYPSIPQAALSITKSGTGYNLTSGPVAVSGRWVDTNGNWQLPVGASYLGAPANVPTGTGNQLGYTIADSLNVQVTVPSYTADDLYATRWRSTINSANATGQPSGAPANSIFNPFYPFSGSILGGLPSRPLYDRAERLGIAPAPTPGVNGEAAALLASGEDPGPAPFDLYNPNGWNDRVMRVTIFNDANGNGQLDLLPTYREAYRTFLVQVEVRPNMKLQAGGTAVADIGAEWQGKKQPGLVGNPAADIREWQNMQAMAATPGVPQSLAAFYMQYWRPFTLQNTGNVNLAYIKPEVAYEIAGQGGAPQFIGFPSAGNDPWRALSLLSPPSLGGPFSLVDPTQIFLRTSFDDQLLPDGSSAYGSTVHGIWLQKSTPGAAQAAAVTYVENAADPTGLSINRDPSVTTGPVQARDTWISLCIPTGAALGQYSGTLRFYNDRGVTQLEPTLVNGALTLPGPAGFLYVRPETQAGATGTDCALDGVLDRDPGTVAGHTLGTALEADTDPPLTMKVKVTENELQGRYPTAAGNQDPADRRTMPTVIPDLTGSSSNPGQVMRILLGYVSNRDPGNTTVLAGTDSLFMTVLSLDTTLNRDLFPFDELPLDRPPWTDLNGNAGWSELWTAGANTIASKPSLAQDSLGNSLIGWSQRQTLGPGSDVYNIFYQIVESAGGSGPNPNPPQFQLMPGGVPLDGTPRGSVRMVPQDVAGGSNWLAFWSSGKGNSRTMDYSWTNTPGTQTSWTADSVLPTSRALATVDSPSVTVTDPLPRTTPLPGYMGEASYLQPEDQTLPQMAWTSYQGTSQSTGKTDIYLSRYRLAALTANLAPGQANPVTNNQNYAQVSFPRFESDPLRADPTRTIFTSSGADWLLPVGQVIAIVPQPTAGPSAVQAYIGRPDVPAGSPGSLTNPVSLIDENAGSTILNAGEFVFSLSANLQNIPGLANQKIIVNPAAGTMRLTVDSRTLARLVIPVPGMTPQSPDPVVTADYTAATLRLTHGDTPASSPVIVPVFTSAANGPVMDASWYLEQMDGNWNQGIATAGQADRLWLFWRRSTGAVSGGSSCYYKVLRPGVRVTAGAISGIVDGGGNSSITVTGGASAPQEVNPATGQIFFTNASEGQRVQVTYTAPNGVQITDNLVVNWQDEMGEHAVPMDTSINEGTLDAFASFESVPMASGGSMSSVNKLERMWLFWGSTRGTGGDLFYAALAPRIGPDVNVNGSLAYTSFSAANLAQYSPNVRRQYIAQHAAYERLHPFTVPPFTRKGPFVRTRMATTRAANRRANR